MHINIKNSSGIETVSTSILEKLYRLLYGGDEPEYDTLVVDNESDIYGTLYCNILYKYKYDLFTTDFNNLHINYNDFYLYIKDPYVKRILVENNFGDAYGVYLSIASSSTTLPNFGGYRDNNGNQVVYNTDIVSFDELQYFRNVTSLSNNNFNYIANQFESIDLRNVTNVAAAFYWGHIKHCKNSGNVVTVGGQCFERNEDLVEFDFSSVKSIGWQSFYGTSISEAHFGGYSDITLGDNYGGASFASCKLLETVDGLENMISMPVKTRTFEDCIKLKSIDMSSASGSIPNSTFSNCNVITSIDLSSVSGSIGEYAFFNCYELSTLSLDNSAITSVGYRAFENCRSLTSLSFPNVTTVGGNVFYGCSSLTTLSLPSLTAIGWQMCRGCSSLTTLSLPSIESDTLDSAVFMSCSSLTTVTGLDGIKKIGNSAFNGCTNLTSVGNMKPTQVGDSAFLNCTMLSGIDLSDVTTLGQTAFQNTPFTNIDLTSLTSCAGGRHFNNCKNLTSVKWSDTLDTIPSGIFGGCSSLTTVTNISNVKTIQDGAFNGCDIRSLSLPNVETIAGSAFVLNKNLSSVSIPKIKYLGYHAISGCNLTTIDWHDFVNVEYWGEQVFHTTGSGHNNMIDCEKLVFNKIQYLGRSAFTSFENLTTIILNVDAMPTTESNIQYNTHPFTGLPSSLKIYIKDDIWDTVPNCNYYTYIQDKIYKLSTYTGTLV